jgi:hypothetical protein
VLSEGEAGWSILAGTSTSQHRPLRLLVIPSPMLLVAAIGPRSNRHTATAALPKSFGRKQVFLAAWAPARQSQKALAPDAAEHFVHDRSQPEVTPRFHWLPGLRLLLTFIPTNFLMMVRVSSAASLGERAASAILHTSFVTS